MRVGKRSRGSLNPYPAWGLQEDFPTFLILHTGTGKLLVDGDMYRCERKKKGTLKACSRKEIKLKELLPPSLFPLHTRGPSADARGWGVENALMRRQSPFSRPVRETRAGSGVLCESPNSGSSAWEFGGREILPVCWRAMHEVPPRKKFRFSGSNAVLAHADAWP